MGWAMASYNRSIRLAQQDKSNISCVGTVFQFLWHFFITGTFMIIIYLYTPLYSTSRFHVYETAHF